MDVSFCYSPEDCTRSTVCLTVSCFWSSASADQYICSGIVHRCAGWLLIIKWTIFQCAHCDEVNTVGFIASMPVYSLLWHWDFALRPVALDSLYQGILHMPSLKRCKWCNFNWFSFNYTCDKPNMFYTQKTLTCLKLFAYDLFPFNKTK